MTIPVKALQTEQKFNKSRILLSLSVFIFTTFMLGMVQWKVAKPMILLERFIPNGGWIELFLIALYGAFVAYKMYDASKVPTWRKYTWTLFSVVFFGQLILGISGLDSFLMTAGKYHLPIPALIIGGPVYRYEIGFMTILFLSTIILSGPAWCSHLCYFGALDNVASSFKKPKKGIIKHRTAFKASSLVLVVTGALIARFAGVPPSHAAFAGGAFGIIGILIITIVSRRSGKMVHCTSYCPVGTAINYLRFINPFRMYIDDSCTLCNICTTTFRYDALDMKDIKNKKPGITCTLCGDCVSSCHSFSIKYKFFGFSPEFSRNLYLFITISLHAIFLALARL